MKEITILEILLVTILLLMPIIAGYFAWRTFKLKKSVELLRIDRNKLLEKSCSDIMFRTIEDGRKVIGELLSDLEKKMILNALKMPEYKKAMDEPSTHHHVRKTYRELKEKIKESFGD